MIDADDAWDAGDLACGHLLIALRNRLRTMPGGVLEVIARDPGAREDMPVWCRLSGNELIDQDPDRGAYWIRSKVEWL